MEIREQTARTQELVDRFANIWRKSVSATHTFLTPREIDAIEPEVRAGLNAVENLALASDESGAVCGFMGVENRRLEMLFVESSKMGKGAGRKLVEYGIEKYRMDNLTVNEQNPQAAGFYEHLGFKAYKRSALDEQHRPSPLIYMKLP